MKSRLAFVLGVAVVITLFVFIGIPNTGCSTDELHQSAADHPSLATTTRAVDSVENKIDPLAQKGEVIANRTQQAAQGAAAIGVPYATAAAAIAGLIGTALGTYNERRRGTLPMSAATVQLANAWHDEGPAVGVSPAMQSALNTIGTVFPPAEKLIRSALPAAKTA